MRTLLLLFWLAAVPVCAVPTLDCTEITLAASATYPADAELLKRRNPLRPLVLALNSVGRGRSGKSLTYAAFKLHSANIALYLLGIRSHDQMKGNPFYSMAKTKLDLENALQGLREEEATDIRRALEEEIAQHFETVKFSGKTSKDLAATLAQAPSALLITHQKEDLQEATAGAIKSVWFPAHVPAVWLVGMESSSHLTAPALDAMTWARFSSGGGFSFRLDKAEVVYLAGGAIDQCLAQTILSIIQNTKAKQQLIRILTPITYIDQIGSSHTTLVTFLPSEANDAETRRDKVEEITSLLSDENIRLDTAIHTRARPAELGQTLHFKKGQRKITVEFTAN